jgi:hypothetical protein
LNISVTAIIVKLPPSPVKQTIFLEYPLFNLSITKPLPLTKGFWIRANLCSKADASGDITGGALRCHCNLQAFPPILSLLTSMRGTTILHPWEWVSPAITSNEWCGSPLEDPLREHSCPSEGTGLSIKVGGRGGISRRGWFIVIFQFTLVNEPEETLSMGYSVLYFPFDLDFNHFCVIISPTSRKIRIQHHMLDLYELHTMKVNLIPVSYLEGLKQRRRSLIRTLFFLLGSRSLFNDWGDLINNGNCDDWGRCLLAMLVVLIFYQINDLFEIVF